MRKHYIDNLRWMTVLLLFPFHTFMIYNSFGESFYIKGVETISVSAFIVAAWPWMMPLLFTIAGISSAYAFRTRTPKAYLKERVSRLLIPLIFGVLLIIPLITYFAERFHNGYAGGYIEQYLLFMTKATNLTGYQGGFTPGHFWFILYLFLISLLALPVMSVCKKSNWTLPVEKINLFFLLMLFLVPLLLQPILDISGKSIGEYFAFFLLGYFILSAEPMLQLLAKHRFLLTGLFLAGIVWISVVFLTKQNMNPILYEIIVELYAWIGVLALLGIGRQYLDFDHTVTRYFSNASFAVYEFHLPCIVVLAYFINRRIPNPSLQVVLILAGSIPITFLLYELFRRISVTRFMFGLKRSKAREPLPFPKE
ncbi:MAG: acyltransferase family protein [Clostridiales bacterium]|nr:acyltransferase family protein [Clostridiales bacterium]